MSELRSSRGGELEVVAEGAVGRIAASIIVPFHNSEEWIRQCIDSLLNQDFPPSQYEIIMIDNNSADGSRVIAEEHPKIRLLTETRHGPYAARNLGVRAARGTVLVFTDPDCTADPGWLGRIMSELEDPAVSVVLGSRRPPQGNKTVECLFDYDDAKIEHICESSDPTAYFGYANNMAIRRDVWEQCGPFHEFERGSDTILVRTIVDRHSCSAVHYLPSATVEHCEVTSLLEYSRKMFVYGRSYQRYSKVISARSLGLGERMMVVRKLAKRSPRPRLAVAQLVGNLSLGYAGWLLGRCAGGFASWRTRVTLPRWLRTAKTSRLRM
jgi:glycosyltransferase involved in cell wall biosynthesis